MDQLQLHHKIDRFEFYLKRFGPAALKVLDSDEYRDIINLITNHIEDNQDDHIYELEESIEDLQKEVTDLEIEIDDLVGRLDKIKEFIRDI